VDTKRWSGLPFNEAIVVYPDTYSQYDEQQAILAYFEKSGASKFLDIGAWDPKCFSNTRALYERGWSGVMIEPSPTPMLSLLKEYGNEPRITLVQAAVGLEDSIVAFQMTDDSVSTSDPESYAKWKNAAAFLGRVYVRTITFEQIAVWYGGFAFVNLDAEGISVDLFHKMLETGAKPACCCVEHDGRLTELASAATGAGYKMTYANGTNAVFTL
jgi:FkbM family methyltransferase